MSITLRATLSDKVNFPSPPIDLGGEIDETLNFDSIYGNLDFAFTVRYPSDTNL
jgi:hypothetical protein